MKKKHIIGFKFAETGEDAPTMQDVRAAQTWFDTNRATGKPKKKRGMTIDERVEFDLFYCDNYRGWY